MKLFSTVPLSAFALASLVVLAETFVPPHQHVNCKSNEAFLSRRTSQRDMTTSEDVPIRNDSSGGVMRRQLFIQGSLLVTTAAATSVSCQAASGEYRRETKDFAYAFVPPPDFETSQKPVKTHLEEINFVSANLKGYQIGITVDPVRINSLKEFGTPGEVAARVVTAEVNRDGVFEVKLTSDAVEDTDTGAYEINYLSSGKRGNKHFVAYVNVKNNKLYVLTGQVKEENYEEKQAELLASVRSFRAVSS